MGATLAEEGAELRKLAMIEDGLIPAETKTETGGTPEPKQAETIDQQPAAESTTTETKSTDAEAVSSDQTDEAQSSLTTTESSKPAESSGEKPAEEKQPSKFEKAKSRQQKEWEAIQEEKARQKAERERLESERQAFLREREEARGQKVEKRFDAADYREAAKGFRDEGREDLAKAAEEKAAKIETEERQESERRFREQSEKAWNDNLVSMADKHPELKDAESKLHKKVSELLKTNAVLRSYPLGIVDAVRVATLELQAEDSTGLKDEVEKLRKENAEFKKRLQPAVGAPATPAAKKRFEDMNLKEQGEYLRNAAQEFDRAG